MGDDDRRVRAGFLDQTGERAGDEFVAREGATVVGHEVDGVPDATGVAAHDGAGSIGGLGEPGVPVGVDLECGGSRDHACVVQIGRRRRDGDRGGRADLRAQP